MSARIWFTELTPERAIELFVVANLALLGGDIAIAHMANHFAVQMEWAPLVFSACAVPMLLAGILGIISERSRRWLDLVVACGAIALGMLGTVYHLAGSFLASPSLHNLVYAAPFAAPLAYIGVGLLLVLARMEAPGSAAFGPWVLVLSLGGVAGNFVLSLLDHAQNGLFRVTEWIPVVTAAFVASFLSVAVWRPTHAFLKLCYVVCAIEAAVGLLGFALHLDVSAGHAAPDFMDRLIYGAPAFAPLLFANMALLSAIGLWATLRAGQ